MDNQLKFVIKTNGKWTKSITASIITNICDQNNISHTKKIHLTKGINQLVSYAEKTAKQKNINYSKTEVNWGDGIKTTIVYDKANLILSNYRRMCTNRNRKVLKNALVGLSGLIAAGSVGTVINHLQEEQDYSVDSIELLTPHDHLLDDTLEDSILQEVKNNSTIPNVSFEHKLSDRSGSSIEISDFSFEYQDRSNDERVTNAKRYMEVFQKVGPCYGIDPNLLVAIMAQESAGIHHDYSQNGCAIGGMQIENFWHNKNLTAYNFETQSEETIVVSEERLKDFWYNAKVACMILQNSLKDCNFDIPKAIQTYNYGTSNMNYLGNDWINNRNLISNGDYQYVEHVLSFLPSGTTLSALKPDGSICSYTINNTISNTHRL